MHHRRAVGPLLVAGATGAVGREVVRALLDQGAEVRVFVRSLDKVAALPERVERVVGDLGDRDAIARALRGVHASFFVSPHDRAEEALADNVLSAARREGKRVVFAGVHADGPNRAMRFVRRSVLGAMMPHYLPKLRIAERVRAEAPDAVVLVPGNYFQNDEICREHILSGVYPMPIRRAPRVDTRDVGEAAARAMLDPTVAPGAYALVAESLGGEQVAAHWSEALGREVRYEPDPAASDRLLEEHYGGRKAEDFQKTYRLLARFAIGTRSAEREQTWTLLGRPPRPHLEYARECAARWTGSRHEVPSEGPSAATS